MIPLRCKRCSEPFDSDVAKAYCPACAKFFADQREHVHQRQRPAPGVFADGKFAKESPQTFRYEDKQICGLCGSDELEQGYGLGSGYGMGSYTWCESCGNFLDFHEDLS